VPYTDHLIEAPDDSFGILNQVHGGLHHEYVDGVITGVRESDAVATLGSGDLVFTHGQHSLTGSSFSVFRRLARCVLCLLACDDPNPTDDELAAIVGGELKRAGW
jgi:hypothetical protein